MAVHHGQRSVLRLELCHYMMRNLPTAGPSRTRSLPPLDSWCSRRLDLQAIRPPAGHSTCRQCTKNTSSAASQNKRRAKEKRSAAAAPSKASSKASTPAPSKVSSKASTPASEKIDDKHAFDAPLYGSSKIRGISWASRPPRIKDTFNVYDRNVALKLADIMFGKDEDPDLPVIFRLISRYWRMTALRIWRWRGTSTRYNLVETERILCPLWLCDGRFEVPFTLHQSQGLEDGGGQRSTRPRKPGSQQVDRTPGSRSATVALNITGLQLAGNSLVHSLHPTRLPTPNASTLQPLHKTNLLQNLSSQDSAYPFTISPELALREGSPPDGASMALRIPVTDQGPVQWSEETAEHRFSSPPGWYEFHFGSERHPIRGTVEAKYMTMSPLVLPYYISRYELEEKGDKEQTLLRVQPGWKDTGTDLPLSLRAKTLPDGTTRWVPFGPSQVKGSMSLGWLTSCLQRLHPEDAARVAAEEKALDDEVVRKRRESRLEYDKAKNGTDEAERAAWSLHADRWAKATHEMFQHHLRLTDIMLLLEKNLTEMDLLPKLKTAIYGHLESLTAEGLWADVEKKQLDKRRANARGPPIEQPVGDLIDWSEAEQTKMIGLLTAEDDGMAAAKKDLARLYKQRDEDCRLTSERDITAEATTRADFTIDGINYQHLSQGDLRRKWLAAIKRAEDSLLKRR